MNAFTRFPQAQPGRQKALPRLAFTLIELLTVVAIIAVLVSLMLTSLASARKKSQAAVCTMNLRQMSLALNLYMDDRSQRPGIEDLVANRYLATNQTRCASDKTGDWGRQVVLAALNVASNIYPNGSFSNSITYSCLAQPLAWEPRLWDRLTASGSAGWNACELHGLGKQDNPDLRAYSGLLLRAQRDGAVVRRQHFWQPVGILNPAPPTMSTWGTNYYNPLYPLDLFLDDPGAWLKNASSY